MSDMAAGSAAVTFPTGLAPRWDHGARGWLGHTARLDRVGIVYAECLRVGYADAERLGRFG
ncbi:MAG: hypothetical protein H0W97_12615 [Actinobacteria bacterium]|nr:hypothetical protein [Actinomycetota bacterium]